MSRPLPRPSIALGRVGIAVMLTTLVVLALAARLVPGLLENLDAPAAGVLDWSGSVELARQVSSLGSTHLTVGVAAAASILTWKRCRPLAVAYPTAVIGGLIVNVVLKVGIGRPRPPVAMTSTALDSFPSGHTIQAVIALGILPPVVYALTGRRSVALITVATTASAAIAVGLSRIALGAHWPTDVVAGAIVGVLVLVGTDLALARLPPRWLPPCAGCPLHRGWQLDGPVGRR